jgi:hypothetical protein
MFKTLSITPELAVRFSRGVSFQLAADTGIASWKLTPLISEAYPGRRCRRLAWASVMNP